MKKQIFATALFSTLAICSSTVAMQTILTEIQNTVEENTKLTNEIFNDFANFVNAAEKNYLDDKKVLIEEKEIILLRISNKFNISAPSCPLIHLSEKNSPFTLNSCICDLSPMYKKLKKMFKPTICYIKYSDLFKLMKIRLKYEQLKLKPEALKSVMKEICPSNPKFIIDYNK